MPNRRKIGYAVLDQDLAAAGLILFDTGLYDPPTGCASVDRSAWRLLMETVEGREAAEALAEIAERGKGK